MKRQKEETNELDKHKLKCENENSILIEEVELNPKPFKCGDFCDSNYRLDEESGWFVSDDSAWLYNKDNDVYYSSSLSKLFRLDTDGLKLVEMSTNSEMKEVSNEEVLNSVDEKNEVYLILDRDIHAGTSVIPSPSKTLEMCEDRHITKRQFPIELVNSEANSLCYCTALFDGHAGFECVEYVYQRLLTNIFAVYSQNMSRYCKKEMNSKFKVRNKCINNLQTNNSNELDSLCKGIIKGFEITNNNYLSIARKKKFFDGTTALICMIFGPDPIDDNLKLVIGNCGDSKLILGYRDEDNSISAKCLTNIHRPNEVTERARIERAGGRIEFCNGTWRVLVKKKQKFNFEEGNNCIGLSISRSVGDIYMKEPQLLCTSEPEITIHNVDLDNDLFLILATDGITDFISNEESVNIVGSKLNSSPTEAANELTKIAEKKGSLDDKTATVIFFNWSISEFLKLKF